MHKILFSLIFAVAWQVAAADGCMAVQRQSLRLDKKTDLRVQASVCAGADDDFALRVRLFEQSRLLQTQQFVVPGHSVLALDAALDINGDGIADVGIANGMGRAGDGMYYFVVDARRKRLLLAGDVPRLRWSRDDKPVLFALQPGSGAWFASRQEYDWQDSRLLLRRTIQIKALADDGYQLAFTGADGATLAPAQLATAARVEQCLSGRRCE